MKAYTDAQWEAIDDWVEDHLVLIRVCGLKVAEGLLVAPDWRSAIPSALGRVAQAC